MAMANTMMAEGGVDPRLSMSDPVVPMPPAIRQRLHDPSILLEEYFHYAKIQRDLETRGLGPAEREAYYQGEHRSGSLSGSGHDSNALEGSDEKASGNEKGTGAKPAIPAPGTVVTAAEWETASRAGRNATWGAIVYLITTDILGPMNAPFAISQFGYVGGTLIYACMGIAAFYAGWMIWRMFLKLDSDRYPMRTFGDLGYRIYGTYTRHGMNLLQSIQLLFNVGVIILGNGMGFAQVTKFKLCFAVCCIIWPILGFLLGQIRTLQKFGYVANFAIWLNVLVIIFSMAVACHSLPNYVATPFSGAISHTVWVPKGATLFNQVNAAMQIVYAYGGAMIYCEFMSEMRRPMDFIKAQFVAEIFIFVCYLIFGLVMYSQQGQYVYNPANQGLSPYGWQTATNILSLLSALIAGALYGNIGIKVIYQNIIMDIFNGPPLTTRVGKLMWVGLVPLYWSLAYIIAAAVPQFTNISSMVSAVCIMQFTYTFPAILYWGLLVQEDAMLPEEAFDPATGRVQRQDSWASWSRWRRGLFRRHWYHKALVFAFFLASLATAGLGMYTSGTSIRDDFKTGHSPTSFSCHAPNDNS